MAEEIKIEIVADDSDLMNSFEEIQKSAEELDETAKELSESIDNTFRDRKVKLDASVNQAATSMGSLDKNTKKTNKSLTRFSRGANRGISALSRFSGVGGKAT